MSLFILFNSIPQKSGVKRFHSLKRFGLPLYGFLTTQFFTKNITNNGSKFESEPVVVEGETIEAQLDSFNAICKEFRNIWEKPVMVIPMQPTSKSISHPSQGKSFYYSVGVLVF